MLSIFSLLPLLKGWDFRIREWTRTVNRGQTIEVDRIDAPGWLLLLHLITTDLYGGMRFEYQGADLELHVFGMTPNIAADLGAFAQDPSGWMQLHYQPNPQSTAGQYVGVQSHGYQGYAVPYVPTTIVKLYLEAESTQESATVHVTAHNVEITSPSLFMRSLRSVLGMPVILPIDPALLVSGREELTMKGVLEKEGKKK